MRSRKWERRRAWKGVPKRLRPAVRQAVRAAIEARLIAAVAEAFKALTR